MPREVAEVRPMTTPTTTPALAAASPWQVLAGEMHAEYHQLVVQHSGPGSDPFYGGCDWCDRFAELESAPPAPERPDLLRQALDLLRLRPTGTTGPQRSQVVAHGGVSHVVDFPRGSCVVCRFLAKADAAVLAAAEPPGVAGDATCNCGEVIVGIPAHARSGHEAALRAWVSPEPVAPAPGLPTCYCMALGLRYAGYHTVAEHPWALAPSQSSERHPAAVIDSGTGENQGERPL